MSYTFIDSHGRPCIYSFGGPYECFSNFSDDWVLYEGLRYPTSEHAFAAAKTLVHQKKLHIQGQSSPGKAKHEGRLVGLRPDWEEVKFKVMHDIVLAKFTQNHDANVVLKSTDGQWIMEGNQHNDQVWGCTRNDYGNWIGHNFLGMILMSVRDIILSNPDSRTWNNYGYLPWGTPDKPATRGLDCFH